MVVLHYKKTDLNQFLMETHTAIKVEELLEEVCESKYLLLIFSNLNTCPLSQIILEHSLTSYSKQPEIEA